jgi:hypothetical protein
MSKVFTGAELERLLAAAADPTSNIHLMPDGRTFVLWDMEDPDDGFAGFIGVRGDEPAAASLTPPWRSSPRPPSRHASRSQGHCCVDRSSGAADRRSAGCPVRLLRRVRRRLPRHVDSRGGHRRRVRGGRVAGSG